MSTWVSQWSKIRDSIEDIRSTQHLGVEVSGFFSEGFSSHRWGNFPPRKMADMTFEEALSLLDTLSENQISLGRFIQIKPSDSTNLVVCPVLLASAKIPDSNSQLGLTLIRSRSDLHLGLCAPTLWLLIGLPL